MDVVETLRRALEGRYALERELGQGGMATVYLARDLRHDRAVALKVVQPGLAAALGAERFLREIRTTAQLTHPHILPLLDSGEADGTLYYVMPYVEGESLRDRLTRESQLPVEEAVRIATEVASALDYAHRHGVVHRDIKPENVLLEEGQALVADFGIALAVHTAGAGTRITETGMSLGTPHYMAPEQAMGQKEITPKADIYALGCVLYEMLVGEPPFTGPTAQAIVARVVTEQPRALALQRHTIPPHVEAAVLRALEKLPADRPASAAQFAEALTHPMFATAAYATPAARSLRDRRTAIVGASAAVLAVLMTLAVWALSRPRPPVVVSRYGLSFPASQAPLANRPFALSPDGAFFAYVGPGPDGSQLWVKARDRYEATPLTGTAGVYNFTFSPDGQWVAFVQNGRLKKLRVIGGAAITLADSVAIYPGLAWLGDGSLVYILQGGLELRRVPDVGGPSTTVWRGDVAFAAFQTPLPGGRGVLFTTCRGGSLCELELDLWALDLRSGVARRLLTGGAMGQYVRTGHVVYFRSDGAALAVPFDARSLQVRGSPVPVLDSVSVVGGIGALATISSQGTLIMRSGALTSGVNQYEMVWVDRAGRETPVDSAWTFRTTAYGGNAGWALSPDASRLAIGLSTDAGDDVWIKLLPRGPLSRLTFDSSAEFHPRWMPDGRSVMFVAFRDGREGLFRRRTDGMGGDEPVLRLRSSIFEGVSSRDGSWLIFRTGATTGGRDILGSRPRVDSVPVPLVADPTVDEEAIALSPDGRWLAYKSNETGRTEVYVRPFPNTEAGKWQVSTGGGTAPIWAPGGRELFYVNGAREMVVTAVTPGPSLQLGERRVLFRLPDELLLTEHYTPFDVAPDGRRFIMARRVRSEAAQAGPLIVVENWFEELKQRLAGR